MNFNSNKTREYSRSNPPPVKNITKWSNEDVMQWIKSLNLTTNYSEAFVTNNINGYDLINLTPEQLKSDLNISRIHDQNVILKNIKLEIMSLFTYFIYFSNLSREKF